MNIEMIKDYNYENKGDFLINCLEKLNFNEHYEYEGLYEELIGDKYENIEDLLDVFDSKVDIARAIYFGNIGSWCDDYFFINRLGNISSQNKYQYLKDIEEYGDEILKGIIEYYISEYKLKNIKNVDGLIKYIKDNVL